MTMQIEIKNDTDIVSREGVGFLNHKVKDGKLHVSYRAIEPDADSTKANTWKFDLPASVEVWHSNGHHRKWDYQSREDSANRSRERFDVGRS